MAKKRSLSDIQSRVKAGLKVSGDDAVRLMQARRQSMPNPAASKGSISDEAMRRRARLLASRKE